MGTGNRLTFAEGTHLEPVRPNRRKAAALHRAARALVRCQKDSRRRRKVRDRLGQAYRAIRNARANHLHQVSAAVAKSHAFIRSEEHTSELQSLMRISYAVFCLKKKNNKAS